MKRLQRISLLLASALTVCTLTSCGAPPEPETTEAAAHAPTVTASETTAETSSTQASTKAEKTTKAKKKTTQTAPDVEKMFSYGKWNDGSRLEYDFKIDGTGTRTDTAADTSETFRFEVNEKKGTVTFYTGDKGKKQKADYRLVDDTHMTLTFSKDETVDLTFGALIRKDSLPFRMGTWKGISGETYTFRPDGSGQITPAEQDSIPFRYEVVPENNLLILHVAEDDMRPAVYSVSDDGLHMTIAYEYDYAELTWQSQSAQ